MGFHLHRLYRSFKRCRTEESGIKCMGKWIISRDMSDGFIKPQNRNARHPIDVLSSTKRARISKFLINQWVPENIQFMLYDSPIFISTESSLKLSVFQISADSIPWNMSIITSQHQCRSDQAVWLVSVAIGNTLQGFPTKLPLSQWAREEPAE